MAFFWRTTRWLYWGAWLLFGLFMATQDIINAWGHLSGRDLSHLLLLNLGQNLAWGLLSLGTLRVARRWHLRDHPPGGHWIAHLLASAVIVPVGTVVSAGMAFFLLPPKGPLLDAYLRFASQYISFEYLVCYWGVVGLHEAIQILKQHREGELQVSMLEAQLAQAELRAIYVQLNPHFLFNTLNTLSALLHSKPAAADRMLVKLSQLLRTSLEQNREESTSLGQEIGFLEDYLEIERMRFGDRLRVRFAIPGFLRDAQIPSFLLQPLVENAIKHGIAAKGGAGTLDIRARQEGPALVLEVQDDGTGTRPNGTATRGTGIGLRNTRLRLEQLYGQEQSFELRFPPEGGALACIRLPLRLQAASPRFQGSLQGSQAPFQAS